MSKLSQLAALGYCVLALACDGNSQATALCEAYCSQAKRCGMNEAETCSAEFQNSCKQRSEARLTLVQPKFTDAFTSCIKTTCSEFEQCYEQALTSQGATVQQIMSNPDVMACNAKVDECSSGDDISDDACVYMLIGTAKTVSSLKDCMQQPCDQAKQCVDTLFSSAGNAADD